MKTFIIIYFLSFPAYSLNLDFKQIKLSEALNIYADFTEKNIIIDSSIDETITLSLKNVDSAGLLQSLAYMYDLVYKTENNIMTVMKRDAYLARHMSQITQVIHVHHLSVVTLLKTLESKQSLKKRILKNSIKIHKPTNTIILQGTKSYLDRVTTIVTELDKPQKQLVIEAKLLGIGSSDMLNLGMKLNNTAIGRGGNQFDQLIDLGVASSSSYGFLIKKAGKFALDLELMMLAKDGKAKIISTPSIFTSNNQKASVQQGVQIPYTVLDDNGSHHTEFIEAVTSLSITPRIHGNDIFLDIFITKDSLGDLTTIQEQTQPSIDTRQIKSTIKLKDGDTVVLGGISDHEEGIIYNKIPWLSDIPYIGKWLFSSSERKKSDKNLIVFITPKIINAYNETTTIDNYQSINP